MKPETDLPLFLQIQPSLARGSDPMTSKAGAIWFRRGRRLARQQRAVYRVLCEHPGATAREIAVVLALADVNVPARRLPSLEERGFVKRGPRRKCHVTGMIVGTWYPVGRDRGTLSAGQVTRSRPERRDPVSVLTPEQRRAMREQLATSGNESQRRFLSALDEGRTGHDRSV